MHELEHFLPSIQVRGKELQETREEVIVANMPEQERGEVDPAHRR